MPLLNFPPTQLTVYSPFLALSIHSCEEIFMISMISQPIKHIQNFIQTALQQPSPVPFHRNRLQNMKRMQDPRYFVYQLFSIISKQRQPPFAVKHRMRKIDRKTFGHISKKASMRLRSFEHKRRAVQKQDDGLINRLKRVLKGWIDGVRVVWDCSVGLKQPFAPFSTFFYSYATPTVGPFPSIFQKREPSKIYQAVEKPWIFLGPVYQHSSHFMNAAQKAPNNSHTAEINHEIATPNHSTTSDAF